jgi:hypothetical protein
VKTGQSLEERLKDGFDMLSDDEVLRGFDAGWTNTNEALQDWARRLCRLRYGDKRDEREDEDNDPDVAEQP